MPRVETPGIRESDRKRFPSGQRPDGMYMDFSRTSLLIPTKLHPPHTLGDVIPRPRLTGKLNQVLERPLALVLAPAGYGKSTLVADWLASVDAPGAWLSLDAGDNILTGFLRYLVAALQMIHPDVGQALLAFLHAPECPPSEMLVGSLIQDLTKVQQDYVLVLDDYHLIKSIEIHDFVDRLIHYAPPTLHLVISSRVMPPLNIHPLRGRGQLVEVRIHELRFTPEEVWTFMQRTWREEPDPQLVSLLWEKTEGWAAGLRIYSLSARESGNPSRTIEQLPSREIALDYLYHEVYSHQSGAVQACLLLTAAVDRFSAALCDYLCAGSCGDVDQKERIAGRAFINWLEEAGMFAVPLDRQREWYRYHHLFQDLLRRQLLHSRGRDFMERVHRLASDWFLEQGLLEEAIHHALAAGDVERAADIIEAHKDVMLDADQWGILEKWLSWLPEEVIARRKGLILSQMWIAQFQYDLSRAVQLLAHLETLLAPDESLDSVMAGEISFFRGLPLFWEGNIAESLPYFQQAQAWLPEERELPRATADLYVGVARQFLGQVEETLASFQALLTRVKKDGVRKGRILAVLFITHLIHGDLSAAYRYVHELTRMTERVDDPFHRAWTHYVRGYIHFSWHELEIAEKQFRQAVDYRYFLDINSAVDSFMGLALTYQHQHRNDLANQVADDLMAFLHEQRHLVDLWEMWGHSLYVRLALLQGDVERALLHARMMDFSADQRTPLFWLELPRLTQARLHLAAGAESMVEKGVRLLEMHLQEMRRLHHVRHQIEVLTLLAVGYQRQGQADRALDVLAEAVALAERGQIVSPFWEGGEDMARLLRGVLHAPLSLDRRDFVFHLLEMLPQDEKQLLRTTSPTLPEPLTRREVEVLALIAKRYSNREIAAALFISEATVKRHVSNILAKLQARRRQDAVQKAYALGMLT